MIPHFQQTAYITNRSVPVGRRSCVKLWYNSGDMISVPIIIATILTNAASLAEAVYEERAEIGFDIEGVVTLPNGRGTWHMAVEDDSGGVLFRNHSPHCDSVFHKPGERLHLLGKTRANAVGAVFAQCTQAVVTAVQPAPVPIQASIGDVLSGGFDNRLVRMTGTVREVFRDEIDPRWVFMILNCEGSRIAVVFVAGSSDTGDFVEMTDATVSVAGVCTTMTHGLRHMFGRHVVCAGRDAISVATPAPADPFDVPAIGNSRRIPPDEIEKMGRRRMAGLAVAVWDDRHFLLEDSKGAHHRIALANGEPPAFGDSVEAAGFPSTDLYTIHLAGAIWRPATNEACAAMRDDAPVLTLSDFHDRKFGRLNRFMKYNGRSARFTGTVVSIELGGEKYRNCTIRCEDFTIAVNSGSAGGFPEDVAIDSQVEVIGTCVISSGIWHPSVSFPHVEDAPMVVLRRPGDMRVVASPPWWTPMRFKAAVAVLLAMLSAILLWAITLKAVAERRGRQLFRTQIGKAQETLRVEERTRLAVELHDSIAQNLTGAAFQIEAARDASGQKCESSSYLACAEQILKSCRTELRRCIWDLKSNALEAPDFNDAILATVRPVAGRADVRIRFNVPRRLMNDSTAHAILRIVRELVANSVHHGHATRIRVAGEVSGGRLRFSVGDNGCGFDPESSPGPDTGHFGLEGIRERIDKFGGEVKVESSPGKGAKTTITLHTNRERP